MSIQVQTSNGETQEFFSVGEILNLRNDNAALRARVASLEAECEAAAEYINTLEGLVDNGYILYGQAAYTLASAARAQVSP